LAILGGLLATSHAVVSTGETTVPGEYIVVLQKHIHPEAYQGHLKALSFHNLSVVNEFNINEGEFTAYQISGATEEHVAKVSSMAEVRYVDPFWIHHVDQQCTESSAPLSGRWGLARTVHAARLPSPPRYEISDVACGRDVDIYILDTGILTTHVDFGGRARWGGDYTGEGQIDNHGHGTHVASTAGGNAYGISRCAGLVAMKVCGGSGTCPADSQLRALEVVAAAARNPQGKKIVGNMSLGGLFRQASNDAVNAAVNAGASMSVSAGNSNDDACGRSPASAELAFTVMSSTNTDARSGFSSFGRCCQIFAPGSNVEAAWIGSNTALRVASGTSMAAPHAAGVISNWWSRNRAASPADVTRELQGLALRDLVTSPGTGSPNLLLSHNCASQ
jgi:hypothetical protein